MKRYDSPFRAFDGLTAYDLFPHTMRLMKENLPVPTKPVLCCDFDGVLHSYTSGWHGAEIIADPPVPGAIDFLRRATEHFQVHVYSSRSHQEGGLAAMQRWVLDHATAEAKDRGADALAWVFNLHWPTSKPSAKVTLDDRAVTFTGAWPPLDELLAFEPWNKASPRAILNVDAPKYLELERRYIAALQTLIDARRLINNQIVNVAPLSPRPGIYKLFESIDHHVKMAENMHTLILETTAIGETRLRQLPAGED